MSHSASGSQDTLRAVRSSPALGRILDRLTQHPTIESVCQRAVELILDLMDADGATVTQVDGDYYRVVAGAGAARRLVGQRAALDGSFTGKVILDQAGRLFVPDPTVSEGTRERAAAAKIKSGLVVPIMVDGQAVGTLGVLANTQGRYFKYDLITLEAVAHVVSLALRRVRDRAFWRAGSRAIVHTELLASARRLGDGAPACARLLELLDLKSVSVNVFDEARLATDLIASVGALELEVSLDGQGVTAVGHPGDLAAALFVLLSAAGQRGGTRVSVHGAATDNSGTVALHWEPFGGVVELSQIVSQPLPPPQQDESLTIPLVAAVRLLEAAGGIVDAEVDDDGGLTVEIHVRRESAHDQGGSNT